MSASYTLHVAPYAQPCDPQALDRSNLVRDGFSWGAFLVSPLWFLGHRHWLIGGAALLLLAGFGPALRLAGLPMGAVVLAYALVLLLIGLEGASLRRWDYARQGRPAVDVVFAANEADAETKAFQRWLGEERPHAPVAPQAMALLPTSPWRVHDRDHVIGLFPDAEGRR